MSVVVKIQDPMGVEMWSFVAEDEKSLCEMAAMHGVDILRSCGAGFCWVCLCDIVEWADMVELNKVGDTWIDLKRDEDGNAKQVLGCVWGIKSEMFSDDSEHVLILKRCY